MQQKGYAGVSARDIADALAFSKANFFYHVKSKQDLLYHIFVEPLQLTIRRVEEILARQAPAVDTLRALIDLYVQLMTDHTAVMLVWFKERSHLTPEHHAEVIQLERHIQGLANKFYADAIHRGEFRAVHPSLARISIFGMCFMLCRWPHVQDELSIPELKRQLQELACGALLRPTE